ncbi:MAG TPA: hypothetical protein VHV78_10115, partial [Gemmatimonadaceae bacterium]|nr:hypothetical protein [Gemmatimonadaceae bacterium]
RDYLDQHRDPNVPLAITDVTEVFVVFRAVVHVRDGHLLSVVTVAANAAIGITGDAGYLSYARLQIGESIYQSRLLTALQDVPGVEWVELTELSAPYSSGHLGFSLESRYAFWHLPPGLFHIGGTMLDAVYVSPQQIARPSLTGSPTDISVDLTYSGGVNDLH